MIIANFIVPFDPITRQTTLPLEKDDQPLRNVWHLAREKGNMVLVQVMADKEIIDAMKADSASEKPTYHFVEDKNSDPLAVKEIQTNPESTKTFISKVITLATVTKQDWSTPEKSVEALVKCFDAKLADYQAGGIGVATDAKIDSVIDPKEEPIVVESKEEPVIIKTK